MREVIKAADVIRLYQDEYGVDVKRLLPMSDIFLERVEPIGYQRFIGGRPGDDAFYSELMGGRGYDSAEKPEFLKAAEWVANAPRLLDVGSGPGKFSTHCSGEYLGIEFNPGAVREAEAAGRNVRLESLETQPREYFDAVTIFQVLEHVEDPESFAREAALRVSPGGSLVISTPDDEGPMGHALNQTLNLPPHHITRWTSASLTRLVEGLGFHVVEVWHEPLERRHLPLFFSALLNPRLGRHSDFSLRAFALRAIAAAFRRLVPRHYATIPFIRGHTVMIWAVKG